VLAERFAGEEAFAQRDHVARIVAVDGLLQLVEGTRRVVGRQQHVRLGEVGALLQVQVGDDEGFFGGPVERAGAVGEERFAAHEHARGSVILGRVAGAAEIGCGECHVVSVAAARLSPKRRVEAALTGMHSNRGREL
jgi:hypothetical protein